MNYTIMNYGCCCCADVVDVDAVVAMTWFMAHDSWLHLIKKNLHKSINEKFN